MRHNKKNNHLGRKTAHRAAMFSNMATSLIMHKRIFTTVPKAKALRKYVEPLINRSKEDSTNSRRLVFSYLQNKEAVTELFQNVSQKIADRPGGYTRIIKTGYRLGDNAAMCFIELVDYNENMLSDGGAKKAKTRRSRRKASGSAAAATPAAVPTTKEVEEVVVTAEETVETVEMEALEVSENVVAEVVETEAEAKVEAETETQAEVETEAEVVEVAEEATETPEEPKSEEKA